VNNKGSTNGHQPDTQRKIVTDNIRNEEKLWPYMNKNKALARCHKTLNYAAGYKIINPLIFYTILHP
jgi:hypothetical protein